MIRFIAAWWAKRQYIWRQEVEAATAELHAGLSAKLVDEKRALVAQLNTQADAIEANIVAVDKNLVTGFWECVKGHETIGKESIPVTDPLSDPICPVCTRPVTFISQATMTPAENAQSDQERTDAQAMAANNRERAKAEETNAKGSEETIKFFKDQAKNNRTIAEKIRTL